MRIAIYGDSFGVSSESLDTSWFSILSNKLKYNIDNYSISGSSLYVSYTKFIETCNNYDFVIFLVTEPNRYPVEIDFSQAIPKGYRHIPSLGMLDWVRQDAHRLLSKLDTQLLSDVEGWYKASDEQYNSIVQQLFLEKIRLTHNNVILYPCFSSSLPLEMMNTEKLDVRYALFNLVMDQLNKLGFKPTHDSITNAIVNENLSVISGHLTPEFNAFVANLMYVKISTGEWNYEGYDEVQLMHTKEHYYNRMKQ